MGTLQIQSKGALELKNKKLCWRINNQTCDADDEKQKWQLIDGRIHPLLSENNRICVGLEEHVLDDNGNTGIAMTTIDCYPHTFGYGGCNNPIEGGDMLALTNGAIQPMHQSAADQIC